MGEEYSTIAEEAEIISQKRKEEGTILVIPCAQGANEEEKRKHPLLASRLAMLQKGTDTATSANDDSDDGKVQNINDATTTNGGDEQTKDATNNDLEDEVVKQLIQSANQTQKDKEYDGDNTTPSGRGLVIAAPSKNNLITQQTNTTVNEDEQFKQELAHHASDVDPTSSVYANVAIGDFGSALLRGMGWKGGDNNNNTNKNSGNKNEEIKPRPHRLGLGAAPLPLPSTTTSTSSKGGIHRRARRPDEVKRDEERQKQQEEAERIAAEKKRLDVQVTLQPGSVVYVRDEDNDESKRARVVKTAGVPGLNRILVQMEGSTEDISVAKGSVKLCSWDELERRQFHESHSNQSTERERTSYKSIEGEPQRNGSSSRRKRSRSYDSEDERRSRKDTAKYSKRSSDRDRYNEKHHERDLSDDDSRDRKRRSKKHKRKKRHHRDRSYSRSRSRTRSRSPDDHKKRHKHESHYKSSSNKYQSSESHQQQQHLNWLIPNIRVRLISKKIPAYYLQKGVVQDVTRTSQSSPKAVLLMDNGQVIDKVPERYLETALPKTGGNVIVLEGKHHWKKGRLLERSNDGGYGVIQFTEDLEVVNISLDSIAEWCLNYSYLGSAQDDLTIPTKAPKKPKKKPKKKPEQPAAPAQIPLPDKPDPEILKLDPTKIMKKLQESMSRTTSSMKQLQEWDRANGLPKSHSQTMVNSNLSRKQLAEGTGLTPSGSKDETKTDDEVQREKLSAMHAL